MAKVTNEFRKRIFGERILGENFWGWKRIRGKFGKDFGDRTQGFEGVGGTEDFVKTL
jgi:hypothetical protein